MERVNYPKLLIISHNLFEKDNNIGKTLVSLLDGWPADRLCQISFSGVAPSFDFCEDYYIIKDKAVLKSTLSFGKTNPGVVLTKAEKKENIATSDLERKMYRFGNKRYAAVCAVRDTMWRCGAWKNKALDEWLEKMSPDAILFVPNDYTLAYDVCLYVERKIKKPIIPFYMDDSFYFRTTSGVVDGMRRKELQKLGRQINDKASLLFTISEKMSREYGEIFGLPCFDFMNSVKIGEKSEIKAEKSEKIRMCYVGNLHSNRWKTLCRVGKALDAINEKGLGAELEVFSWSDLSDSAKEQLQKVKSIRFYGKKEDAVVEKHRAEAHVLLHVDAFDKKNINNLRLSLATKIPEYLAIGACIFAYGPKENGTIGYVEEYGLGVVCSKEAELEGSLCALLSDEKLRRELSEKAWQRAVGYHNINETSKRFKAKIIEATEK